ncbi:hypothetical protein [Petrachloros mirabilis]
MSECICKALGFCERHNCQKGRHAFHLCQTSQLHRDMWERGEGAEQIVPDKSKPREWNGTPSPDGPGTHLRRIIANWQRRLPAFNLSEYQGCKCGETARLMDRWGPEGCRKRLPEILKRLEAEAIRRNLTIPFRRMIAKRMVLTAIRRAERSR